MQITWLMCHTYMYTIACAKEKESTREFGTHGGGVSLLAELFRVCVCVCVCVCEVC